MEYSRKVRDKKIIRRSVALGGVAILFVTGSLWLLKKPTPTSVKNTAPPTPPQPAVVTVNQLSPEELARLTLQTWYARDFKSMYTLLNADAKTQESQDVFAARMHNAPVILGVRVSNVRRTDADAEHATLTLHIDARTSKQTIGRDIILQFTKTNNEWKIASLPDFNGVDKKQ